MKQVSINWLIILIVGIALTFFSLFFGFYKLENVYIESLELSAKEVISDTKINELKSYNSEIKGEIEGLNIEVNKIGRRMNSLWQDYRTAKNVLDSLIIQSENNPAYLDSILNYYDNQILNNAPLIDSVNQLYEKKSNLLLDKINNLDDNNNDLDIALEKRNLNMSIYNFKIGSTIFHFLILIAGIYVGIFLSFWGFRNFKKAQLHLISTGSQST